MWYQLAAEQGHGEAQFNLGIAYKQGDSVLVDNTTALAWFSLALSNGYHQAQDSIDALKKLMTDAQVTEAESLEAEIRARISTSQ